LEQMKPWSTRGVEGVARFLARVWRLLMTENQAGEWVLSHKIKQANATKAQQKLLHAAIKKVTEDIESFSFNTAISQMMIFVNAFTNVEIIPLSAMRALLILLNPFAPHIASELWETLNAEFAVERNAVDLAVGVIIGGGFGAIVDSLVKHVVLPAISLLDRGLDFSNKFVILRVARDGSTVFNTPADAAKAGAITWTYGNFI